MFFNNATAFNTIKNIRFWSATKNCSVIIIQCHCRCSPPCSSYIMFNFCLCVCTLFRRNRKTKRQNCLLLFPKWQTLSGHSGISMQSKHNYDMEYERRAKYEKKETKKNIYIYFCFQTMWKEKPIVWVEECEPEWVGERERESNEMAIEFIH